MREQALPEGWVEVQDSATDDSLVYAKMEVRLPLSANATLLVRIREDLRWDVSCHGILVEDAQCPVLESFPKKLTTTSAVLDLLHLLQTYMICQGSPVSDFGDLVDARGTRFMDSTGIALSCMHNVHS